MIKLIYEGLPDQGKSYATAVLTLNLLRRNKFWIDKGKTTKPRKVYTEMKLAQWIEEKYAGYLYYLSSDKIMEEIPAIRQADVIIDDMGTRMSAARWQEMPESVKNWFRLMGHYECDVYGNAQDFLDIDISVRRKTRKVISLHKLCGSKRPGETYPPIRAIWGIILKHHVHYSELDKEQWKRKESRLGLPILITRSNCEIYDTLQDIKQSALPPYTCVVRHCTNPDHKDTYGRPFQRFVHL